AFDEPAATALGHGGIVGVFVAAPEDAVLAALGARNVLGMAVRYQKRSSQRDQYRVLHAFSSHPKNAGTVCQYRPIRRESKIREMSPKKKDGFRRPFFATDCKNLQ
ncbi:MAG: hypothetical protein AB7O72_14895, partial [Ramlibacter sp.]